MALILAALAVVGWRWWHNHPPYGPEALAIQSSLSFVDYEEAQRVLGEEAYPPVVYDGDQLVLGRLSWQDPPKPLDGGYFAIFLIDKRTHRKPEIFSVSAPQEMVSVGSAGADNRIVERYPWLRGAGYAKVGDDEWLSNGHRLGVYEEEAAPLTFVAKFPFVAERDPEPMVAAAPISLSDLLLALVYRGPDEQLYWAQRLHG